MPRVTAKVGVVSDVRLSVLDEPVSLAGTRSGAPTSGETVTVNVLVVVMEPSLTATVTVVLPVRSAVGVMAREFAAFAGAVEPVAPVPPVRTSPELGIRFVLLLVIV